MPKRVPERLYGRRDVATGMANPRAILELEDGSLLVAEAGTGDPARPRTGRLLQLRDGDGDGRFEGSDERTVVLDGQPSVHIVTKLAVPRDEVFGMADVARGDGMILASVADPTGGSVVLRVDAEVASVWATTADNANSLAFHPTSRRWYAVQSFANTLVSLPDGAEVARFDALEQGQQAVPSAVVYAPRHDRLLVALFSGQRGGDTAGTGVDFVPRSGAVVSVDPVSGAIDRVVESLNAPVDLAVGDDGALWVLELCQGFEGPTPTIELARSGDAQGGFTRGTGRLLKIDLKRDKVEVIARGLDLPTHVLLLDDGRVLVSEGQGTPGRLVRTGEVPRTIEGRVVELTPGPDLDRGRAVGHRDGAVPSASRHERAASPPTASERAEAPDPDRE